VDAAKARRRLPVLRADLKRYEGELIALAGGPLPLNHPNFERWITRYRMCKRMIEHLEEITNG
jgi:hypothetical protein